MRHDQRLFAEHDIAAGVVAVEVRVHHELQVARRDPRNRSPDLVGQRRELIVDDQDAVLAGRDADVAARAGQHVDRTGDVLGGDLDGREVLLRRGRRGEESGRGHGGGKRQATGTKAHVGHVSVLVSLEVENRRRTAPPNAVGP